MDILTGFGPTIHLYASYCVTCSHFHGIDKGTCPAYPDGIPSRFADYVDGTPAEKHDKVEEDQQGTDTYVWFK